MPAVIALRVGQRYDSVIERASSRLKVSSFESTKGLRARPVATLII